MSTEKFHTFSDKELNGIELPKLFTFPFHYIPHPLCIIAASRVQEHLNIHTEWTTELQEGKMMGVLVVQKNKKIGFLAAFSGNLCHCNNHDFFVPAVYDLLAEKGFFRQEEDEISKINLEISHSLQSSERKELLEKIDSLHAQAEKEIFSFKLFMKEAKKQRDLLRQQGEVSQQLIAESQFQKAELKRIQTRWNNAIDTMKQKLDCIDSQIKELKEERHKRSISLQKRIFQHFNMLNAHGSTKNLCEIFSEARQSAPPAGAGECAAPKLLQYAYLNDYKPIAMAEFWVGRSPKDEIRRHGCFYPSCKTKCEPILNWMLQGLNVEPNPFNNNCRCDKIEILFEDEWLLIVNKPAGMLSVPGKTSSDSLQNKIQRLYPDCESPLIVHRLDMATSGLIIFAKTKSIHKLMQDMFKCRKITKRYIAILDGIIKPDSGKINLPLILNPQERPLQCVNHTCGKTAITRFEVLSRKNKKTRIAFYPETGRTHQLRVHSAHYEGLNTPIVGDSLYGTHSDRLYLHAESLHFTHPVTGEIIHITSQCPF